MSPEASSGAEGLKITSAFVVSSRTTEMELISGKPSMREGPTRRDLPFGQMIFPEVSVIVLLLNTAAEIQRCPSTPARGADFQPRLLRI